MAFMSTPKALPKCGEGYLEFLEINWVPWRAAKIGLGLLLIFTKFFGIPEGCQF